MPEDALELKKNLRCDMKARRNALTDEEKKHAAANCLSKLKELPEFMNADWIYAYIACRNELETADIISWCLSYGKHVAVPKVQGEIMHFYEITVLSDCVPGAFGILEPAGEKKDRITTPGFMLVPGLAFDKNGNLWMTSSEVNHAVLVLDKAGAWHRLDIEQLRGVYTINDILITSTNDKWIYVPRNTPKLVMIPNSESLDEVSSYEFTTLIDTDGKELTPSNYTCVAEDKDGYIWVGTNRGAVYFTKPRISSAEDKAATRCTRVKYTNEETGNLAYFLDNVVVTTLKVDAGNRKWIGTKGNGVYVLDNDNETIVYQFNTTNSPLLSDNIYDIEINDKTGEVFIGTDKGLNSYQGEASEGKSDYSEIYAYPNPVRPEHMDKVTIVGLMDNSNVKITDLNGNIIYQTKSLGGQAIWNCRNASGSRVATGVYLVLASTEEASESVVTKIIVVK